MSRTFPLFALLGALNTALTYGLYLLLCLSLSSQLSYAVSYAAGIALAYVLNLCLVFKSQSTIRKAACYPLVYLVQYLIGAALLHLFIDVLGISEALAPLPVIALLTPCSYFLNKRALAG